MVCGNRQVDCSADLTGPTRFFNPRAFETVLRGKPNEFRAFEAFHREEFKQAAGEMCHDAIELPKLAANNWLKSALRRVR